MKTTASIEKVSLSKTFEQLLAKSNTISKKKALTWAIAITVIAMFVELIASFITGSLMLFSDALHMLSHGSSLGITLLAMILAKKVVRKKYPFGFHRIEILAALFNGLSLIVFSGYVIYEAVERLYHPIAVDSVETIVVAVFGLLVNLATAFILGKAGLEDLNTRSAFMHLLADTFSSVSIIIGGVVIYYTQWMEIDALLSMVVAVVILKWAWGLIVEAGGVLLEKTPNAVNVEEIEQGLLSKFELIQEVEELRIWEISNGECKGMVKIKCAHLNLDNYSTLLERIKIYFRSAHRLQDMNVELTIQ